MTANDRVMGNTNEYFGIIAYLAGEYKGVSKMLRKCYTFIHKCHNRKGSRETGKTPQSMRGFKSSGNRT